MLETGEDPSLSATRTQVDGVQEAAPSFEAPEYPAGSILGRYVVVGKVGAGAMGVVYAAWDPELGRRIAIKVVLARAVNEDLAQARNRLLREAQALARLNHPNVVAVYDVGSLDGGVFVAMEFVEGLTLRAWSMAKKNAMFEVLRVFRHAGMGLSQAHRRGLVHRDFKPDNVMITSEGRVVVMDFGLARNELAGTLEAPPPQPKDTSALSSQASLDSAAELTQQGALVGTPAYMAPEQFLGEAADARSDQFSYCVALWEALYGRRPFRGRTAPELMVAVTQGQIDQAAHDRRAARWIRPILLRGLHRDPAQRWPSMEALVDALSRDPRPRRWAVTGGAALIAVVATTLWSGDARRRATVRGCEALAAETLRVWDEPARERVRQGMLATGAAHATESFDSMDRHIGAWLESVARERQGACRAARVEGSIDETAFEQAEVCAQEQLERLQGTLDVYAEATPPMLAGAVRSATALSSQESCTDWAWLARRPAPPTDTEAASELGAIRRQLGRVLALEDSGDYTAANKLVDELAARAVRIGWAPLVAETSLTRARLLAQLGRAIEARALAEHAFADAIRSADDGLAVRSASMLLRLHAFHLGTPREGLAWARVGEALLARIDRTDSLLAADLANNLGLAWQADDKIDEALAAHQRALSLRERWLGPEHPDLAHSFGNLGNTFAAAGEHEKALLWHERAHALRRTQLGQTHPDTARSDNNAGNALRELGRYDAAVERYQRAITIWSATVGSQHPDTARTRANLARALCARGDEAASFEAFSQAHETQCALLGAEHPETARTLAWRGRCRAQSGDTAGAREDLEGARVVQESALGTTHPDTLATSAALAALEALPADP